MRRPFLTRRRAARPVFPRSITPNHRTTPLHCTTHNLLIFLISRFYPTAVHNAFCAKPSCRRHFRHPAKLLILINTRLYPANPGTPYHRTAHKRSIILTPRDRPRDRAGGFPRLSDGVARASRCPASPRHALLAENLGKPSLGVNIMDLWYYAPQSPAVACQRARAARAAVSARKMRGPKSMAVAAAWPRRRARSSSEKPPSGPISSAAVVAPAKAWGAAPR